MSFTPRPYQVEAVSAALAFFNDPRRFHAIEILPTGSGKSVVIANIGKELTGKTLVFQPSKEILEQNVRKFRSYGFKCGVYSASAGSKHIEKVTFATIGSVAKKAHLFAGVEHVIIDECHLVNPEDGMYLNFLSKLKKAKVLGLTATPYRLTTGADGAMLNFITRSTPRFFSEVIYSIQNNVLFDAGHLAKLEYFSFNLIDRSKLEMNSAGTDFTEASVAAYYRTANMSGKTITYAKEILKQRKNLLVFTATLSEARKVVKGIPGSAIVDGMMGKQEREQILSDFTKGKIKCLINVGVLTTGFDYPELQAVLIARSTMSLSLYYQIVGRVMRPHASKASGWVVDLGGNIELFGKIETMEIKQNLKGQYYIVNNGRQLTDVSFKRAA